MKYYIIIDMGTSNCRIRLINDSFTIIDQYKDNVGVRNTAVEGNNATIINTVKSGVNYLINNNSLSYLDISKIVASGMITSDLGICKVDHVVAPAGIRDFINNSKTVIIKEICNIPITFIPGFKNNLLNISAENFYNMDMMRGEEVETIAVLDSLPKNQEYLIILPGSHTKFVYVDKHQRIIFCLTTLSGEMLSVLSNNTIVASSVNNKISDKYNKQMVLLGYNTSKKLGLARTAFLGRVMDEFLEKGPDDISNFILGAVFQEDIKLLKETELISYYKDIKVVVAGRKNLKDALVDVINEEKIFNGVISYTNSNESILSLYGAFILIKNGL